MTYCRRGDPGGNSRKTNGGRSERRGVRLAHCDSQSAAFPISEHQNAVLLLILHGSVLLIDQVRSVGRRMNPLQAKFFRYPNKRNVLLDHIIDL